MSDPGMDDLIAAILEGDCAASVSHARSLLENGVSSKQVVTDGIEAAMSRLNAKCTLEQFNLLEIMLAGRAVMEIMKFLNPSGQAATGAKGTIVLATLEGDIHDLGKNVLKTILIGRGYNVVDCGKDCPLQKLIETAVKEHPMAVAISGLITPIIPLVRQVKDLLFIRGLNDVKVIAGGAALKQSSHERLNVDFLAESAFDVLPYLDGLAGGTI
jgi:methylmalonyl-CoA mutase cobalamin-binding domain/chain